MSKSKITYILVILFIGVVVSSYLVTKALLYENPIRIYSKQHFIFFEDEQISVLKDSPIIGEKQNEDITDRREIGPLPDGKFISAYVVEGKDYFDEPYWGMRYVRITYKYKRNFSVYDISNQMSFFENEDSAYHRFLNDFESKLSTYKKWRFNPFDNKSDLIKKQFGVYYKKRSDAITYETISQDGINTLRSVYFANKKAYVLEIQSKYKRIRYANVFLSNLTTFNLLNYNKTAVNKIISGFIAFFLFAILLVYICIRHYQRIPIRNLLARKIGKFAFSMTVINVIIVLWIAIKLFWGSNYLLFYSENKYVDLSIVLCLTMATLVFMDLHIFPYLYIKSKKEYQYDFLIHEGLRSYFDSRLDNQQEKKALVSFLYYPLYILGSMPFGIIILIYVLPFALILFVVLEARHLYRWINKDAIPENIKNDSFMDYYVILDLKKEATKDEIDKAFNSAVAKHNSSERNSLYGKEYYCEIQEAFAVLNSTNQLRPEYDKEYERYKNSNDIKYSYINKLLEKEINNIRSKIYNKKPRYKNINVNIVFFSFIILSISAFIYLIHNI
ncbi:MAG: DnaJ domain-containing protein [Prevotella sp.]|nr:DnaJ domain-containing protein [Prevotella sp.]